MTKSSTPNKKKDRARKTVVDPLLVSLASSLRATGDLAWTTRTVFPTDSALADESMRIFTQDPQRWDVPSTRGDGAAFMAAYASSVGATDIIGRLADRILLRKGTINRRADAAGRCVRAAATVVKSSLLTHLRRSEEHDYATCVLLRTAIELAARSIFIACGSGDEVTRFEHGPPLRASEYWGTVRAMTRVREPRAPDPEDVYKWLCTFTHLDISAMNEGPPREATYEALSFVAWLCGVGANAVCGEGSVQAEWVAPAKPFFMGRTP